MNQIDDRLLDYILVTLKEVVEAVSDLYLKHGISDEQLNNLRVHVGKLEEELVHLKKEQREGADSRLAQRSKSEVFTDFSKTYIAPIVTAVLSGIAVALWMTMGG